MKNLKIMNDFFKKIILLPGSISLFVLLFISGVPALAQNIVEINFETDPLFEDLNMLPGYESVKWAKAKNVSDEEQSIAVFADYYEDPGALASQMDIEISSGIETYYSAKLSDFFRGGEIYLSDISPGVEKQYNFKIIFLPESGNIHQGKSLDFDIKMGARSKESLGTENGGGSPYFYGDLIIYNETAAAADTSALISWHTNKLATSRVVYDIVSHPELSGREFPDYGYAFSTVEDPNKVNPHSVLIQGLDPDTLYYFRPVSKASPEKFGQELSFRTGQKEDEVVVLGIEGSPELIIGKECAVAAVNPGSKTSCKIKIENTGNVAAFDVSLRDFLPDGFRFSENSSKEKFWNIGGLGPGEFISLEYSVIIGEGVKEGKYYNRAEAEAFNFEKVTAEAELEVRDAAVLGAELAKTGFDIKELFILLALFFLFFFSSFYLSRKGKQNN